MKKRIVSMVVIISCFILGGVAFVYAKPDINLNRLWGNVLSSDDKDENVKGGKKYKLALKGEYSDNVENINGIAEAGKDVLVTEDEIEKAEKFYKMSGVGEKSAEEKAIKYVEEQNALYVEAIKNGYDITEQELDEYIKELKHTVSIAENKEAVEEVIKSFDSEEEYWQYERELYKKLLPIQKYVKNLEKNYTNKNINKKTEEELKKGWDEKFNKIKEKAVENQSFEEVKDETDIDDKFLKK